MPFRSSDGWRDLLKAKLEVVPKGARALFLLRMRDYYTAAGAVYPIPRGLAGPRLLASSGNISR